VKRILVIVGVVALLSTACDSGAGPTTTTSTLASTTTTTSAATTTTSTTTTLVPVEPVNLVFRGGDVVTMDLDYGTVQAIAIENDVIIAIGSDEETDAYIGPATIVVDLDGRTIIPGFVDPHTHLLTDADGLAEGQPLALRNGITSVGDGSAEPGLVAEFAAADASEELRVRTSLYLAKTDPCGDDQGNWYMDYPMDMHLGNRIRIGGVKIFEGGGVCGALAASEPWLEGFANGEVYHPLETLTSWIAEADALGYQVITHAQGDLTISHVQDAYEAVLDGGENVRRHRIEHNSFVTEAVVNRYGELGIIPTVFSYSPACVPDDGWLEFYELYGDRPDTIIEANPDLVVAWHGDDPWLAPISPLLDLFSYVTRAQIGEDGSICEPTDWMASGAIDVEQGLAMMTINGAYAINQDHMIGSLVPGKIADMALLSANPLTIDPWDIPTIEVLGTFIGAGIEFCLEGSERLCPGW
jgi:predicted amidohydrolase YtcJ